MLKVVYIAPDDFVKPKKLTQKQRIHEAAMETLAVTRFEDAKKAIKMFESEQEEIDRLENELQALQLKLNHK